MRLIDADKLLEEIEQRMGKAHDPDVGYRWVMKMGLWTAKECILDAPTVEPSSNEPLTFDELYEIDGEPVWVELIEPTVGKNSGWALVYSDGSRHVVQRWTAPLWCSEYGETWLAYRRKPDAKEDA